MLSAHRQGQIQLSGCDCVTKCLKKQCLCSIVNGENFATVQFAVAEKADHTANDVWYSCSTDCIVRQGLIITKPLNHIQFIRTINISLKFWGGQFEGSVSVYGAENSVPRGHLFNHFSCSMYCLAIMYSITEGSSTIVQKRWIVLHFSSVYFIRIYSAKAQNVHICSLNSDDSFPIKMYSKQFTENSHCFPENTGKQTESANRVVITILFESIGNTNTNTCLKKYCQYQ